MFRTLLSALAPAFAALALAAPAMSAPATPTASTSIWSGETMIVVGYEDLDLDRARDANILAQRVDRAARNACERPFIRDLKGQLAFEQCVIDAKTVAQSQLSAGGARDTIALSAL